MFGHLKTTNGCYEIAQFNNAQSAPTFGLIYREDPKTGKSIYDVDKIEMPLKYEALIFVTDRVSSPDHWLM